MKNKAFYHRLGFALAGIASAWSSEKSFRVQALAALAVVAFLLWHRPPALWWAVLLMNCGMVMAAELFNTALEHTLDHLSPEIHPAVRIAKDCCAGAVLLLSIASACTFVACIAATGFS
jgi:diacylglycerol kinase (ATP)